MPCYGSQVYAATAKALVWAAQRTNDLDVLMASRPLITVTRNEMWHEAVTRARAEKITHFVFLDADTAPTDPEWLGDVLREMARVDATVLGVVVPLKGPGDLVNVAHDAPGDLWEVPRPNLSWADLGDRPPTWTSPDLLIGTGLLAVDLRKATTSWAPYIKFHVQDEVAGPCSGHPQVASVSEDWDFCRQVRKHGEQVYATTAIKVRHWGPACWESRP